MLRFSLFGFPIAVHWMFWLNSALMGGGWDANSPEELRKLITWMLAAFISVLVHELGHAFLMRSFGARASIMLYSFGGLAIPDRRFNRVQGILVSLAGPVTQIALGLLARQILFTLHPDEITPTIVFLAQLAYVSIWWAILNLAPIYPLDGGRVLADVLGPKHMRLTLQISIGCAALLAGWLLLQRNIIGGLLFGMLAYENLRRLRGERPLSMLDPV